MPDIESDRRQNEYNQSSFIGGMNLLGDDSRLNSNQYRLGINLTNRYDQLDAILQSVEDTRVRPGIKQELITFGNYLISFCGGEAFYRFYTELEWHQIDGFIMSLTASRFWTVAVPVATTLYARYAIPNDGVGQPDTSNPNAGINIAQIQGASAGNLPGLLVQDNINQPWFIFLNSSGIPVARQTQNFSQWHISYTDNTNTVVATKNGIQQDFREYVPIGNSMAWSNGILAITSQDGNFIYRSVSGRPLDFVVNVNNSIATNPDGSGFYTQTGGGDATTTSYSVGVGGISCIRAVSTGWFVSAGLANFIVSLNTTPNAPTIFGEYTFIRTFLFNATCLSDRCIFDSLGDTRFIDLTGVRSFNAVEQQQNEGRNSLFTSQIQPAFTTLDSNGNTINIVQDANNAAAILYDNYELYAMSTYFGPAIVKYDTINNCWSSFDVGQTGGKRIKILAKIELTVQRLYAVTEDDRLFTIYLGPTQANAQCRTIGVTASLLYANSDVKMAHPKSEIKLVDCRVIVNKIRSSGTISFTSYVNNRLTIEGTKIKKINYVSPTYQATDAYALPDVNTQLTNALFSAPASKQGWKVFGLFNWTTGSITQFSMSLLDLKPMNPLDSQATTV